MLVTGHNPAVLAGSPSWDSWINSAARSQNRSTPTILTRSPIEETNRQPWFSLSKRSAVLTHMDYPEQKDKICGEIDYFVNREIATVLEDLQEPQPCPLLTPGDFSHMGLRWQLSPGVNTARPLRRLGRENECLGIGILVLSFRYHPYRSLLLDKAQETRAGMLVGLFERSMNLGVWSGISPTSGSRRRGMPPVSFMPRAFPSISASAQAKLAAIPICRKSLSLANLISRSTLPLARG